MSEKAPGMIWLDYENGFAAMNGAVLTNSEAYRRADLPWLPEKIVKRLRDRVRHHDEMAYFGATTQLLRDILAAVEAGRK